MFTDQHDMTKNVSRSTNSWLHSRVCAALIGLALWFVLGIWSFAGPGVTDYLLVIVSGFILGVIALTFILLHVGHTDSAVQPSEGRADSKHESFHDWAASDFDAYQDRLSGLQAATLILLPLAAAAVGMTAFGIVFLIVEHSVA